MEYLVIEILLLVLFILIHRISKIKIFKNYKIFLMFWFFVFLWGVLWDWFAIARGHWIYQKPFILGIFIGVIPVEDIVFMIVVPYGILIGYKLIEKIIIRKK